MRIFSSKQPLSNHNLALTLSSHHTSPHSIALLPWHHKPAIFHSDKEKWGRANVSENLAFLFSVCWNALQTMYGNCLVQIN